MSTRAEELGAIYRRAEELARTGRYADESSIERALLREGYCGVQPVLNASYTKQELNDLCRRSRAARLGSTAADAA